MSQAADHRTSEADRRAAAWAKGLAYFAGSIMILIGAFNILAGIAAIFRGDVYAFRGDYIFKWDVSGWGWVHLALGILLLLAGVAVFSGQIWARAVGIALAGLNAIMNFMFLPYYPIWTLVIITLDVLVIWALAMYPRGAADSVGTR